MTVLCLIWDDQQSFSCFEEGREAYQMLFTRSKILIAAKIITVSRLKFAKYMQLHCGRMLWLQLPQFWSQVSTSSYIFWDEVFIFGSYLSGIILHRSVALEFWVRPSMSKYADNYVLSVTVVRIKYIIVRAHFDLLRRPNSKF